MSTLLPALLLSTLPLLPATGADGSDNDWPRFRGPNGTGQAEGPAIPESWSAEKNLRWRTPLPGKGTSSPCVSEDAVYLTAYTGYGVDLDAPGDPADLVRHTLAFDRATGQELWRASVPATEAEDPFQGFLTQHGYASSTPVSDGALVYSLMGKSGLFAYDLEGQEVWHRDLGRLSDPARWGDGTSPVLIDDMVVVDAGVLGHRLMALDKETGETLWEIEDPAFTNAWSTPVRYQDGENTLVLFNVPSQVIAVDALTGERVWTVETPLDDAACGGIVFRDDVGYIMGSRAGRAMAFRCGAVEEGESRRVWQRNIRSGIVTPLVVGDSMFWGSGGIFYGASLEDGEYHYRERLPRMDGPTGGFPNSDYSSPVAQGERIVLFTRNGESYVLRAGETFEILAHNPPFPGDLSAFSSTPAIAGGEVFIRSDDFLYCIGKNVSADSGG